MRKGYTAHVSEEARREFENKEEAVRRKKACPTCKPRPTPAANDVTNDTGGRKPEGGK